MYMCMYMYFFLSVSVGLHIPKSGTCANMKVRECTVMDSNRLEIIIAGYNVEMYNTNTFWNISKSPVNISRCNDSISSIGLCMTYVAGEAVTGLVISCSANGKGLHVYCYLKVLREQF